MRKSLAIPFFLSFTLSRDFRNTYKYSIFFFLYQKVHIIIYLIPCWSLINARVSSRKERHWRKSGSCVALWLRIMSSMPKVLLWTLPRLWLIAYASHFLTFLKYLFEKLCLYFLPSCTIIPSMMKEGATVTKFGLQFDVGTDIVSSHCK